MKVLTCIFYAGKISLFSYSRVSHDLPSQHSRQPLACLAPTRPDQTFVNAAMASVSPALLNDIEAS